MFQGNDMKKIYLLIGISCLFANELEVDGNLKVTGDIDASGNPVKNIGLPTTLNDALNGNALQDALRDDGVYEYELFYVSVWNPTTHQYLTKWYEMDGPAVENLDFASKMTELSSQGFYLDRINGSIWIFKRPIETDE